MLLRACKLCGDIYFSFHIQQGKLVVFKLWKSVINVVGTCKSWIFQWILYSPSLMFCSIMWSEKNVKKILITCNWGSSAGLLLHFVLNFFTFFYDLTFATIKLLWTSLIDVTYWPVTVSKFQKLYTSDSFSYHVFPHCWANDRNPTHIDLKIQRCMLEF